MGRRGALIAAVLLATLTVVVVRDTVWAGQGTQERTASSTRTAAAAPVTTAPTTPPAPPQATAATAVTTPPDIQVAGIAVARPAEPEPTTTAPPPCPTPGGADFVDALVNAHRSIRCEQGLGDLALDGAVSEHAQYHADRLLAAGACRSLFHSDELPQWYPTSYWGENAACVAWAHGCSSDAGFIMNGWMNSDEHRPNILDPHFHLIGVGVACDGTHTYVVVQFRS